MSVKCLYLLHAGILEMDKGIILVTEDAHELYSHYGYERVECMRLRRDIY